MNRRDFLGTAAAAAAAAAAGTAALAALGSCTTPAPKAPKATGGRMSLRFYPYELQLAHTFTVATYSRTVTPDVQVEIDYEGLTGYGEASMPPYLGHTVQSVCDFLEKVDLTQFSSPFLIEDIMAYLDTISPGDAPAKAAIDIALHDLCGKIAGEPLYIQFYIYQYLLN